MIRFQQTFGAHTGRAVAFEQDMVSFGRMPDCDVAFDPHADLDASGRHAEVRREGGRWHVIDVGSRNGTWLNGQRIQRAVLSSGDEIEFGMGGPRVRVELVDATTSASASAGRDMTGPMTPAPVWAQPGAMTGAATPVPEIDATPVDGSAQTIAAMATPIPGVPTPPHANVPPSTPHAQAPIVPPTPPPGGAPKQYGERTVGLMIQSALAQAQQTQPHSKSTAEIHAIAVGAANQSSRGLKVVVLLLALLLVVAIAVILVVVFVKPRFFGGADTNVEPAPTEPAAPRIARELGQSVYVLVEQRDGAEHGVCSAFAVASDLLATNAHCILAMQRASSEGATHSVAPNGGQGQRIAISQMWHHPDYAPNNDRPSADVGLVQIVGTAPVVAPLATMAELAELAQGAPVYLLGFPGDLSNVSAPVATISESVLGSVTAFDGSAAPFATAQLLHHEATTGPGTSGSPIFDARGRVIGINAGTFRAQTQQQVVGPNGPAVETVVADTGVKYGVRADLLAGLLAGMGR